MTDPKRLADEAHATRTGSAGWMVQRLAAQVTDDMRARLDALGLKMDHFIMLMSLAEMQGANQSEVGARVGLANYTVTRALDALEDRGLTERRPDEGSRRAHKVFLTRDGEALMPQIFQIVRDLNQNLLSEVPEPDRAVFLRTLSHLVRAGTAPCAEGTR